MPTTPNDPRAVPLAATPMSRSRRDPPARARKPVRPKRPAASTATPTPSPLELEAASVARRAKRERRRKGTSGVCVICGEPDVDVLTHHGRSILHDHHVGGRHLEADTELLVCQNCHAKEHERFRNAGVLLQPQPSTLETLVSIHRSRAVTFESLAGAEARWADRLARVCEVLDILEPTWREHMRGMEQLDDE